MQCFREHSTAILVFANSAKEESKHKRIPVGTDFFDFMTRHTLDSVKKSKLPYFHFSEEQQVGHSFGERFAHAIQSVFDKGFDRVITIGNDSPHLTSSHLINAHSHLENGKTVIGPSADGGFYLMGLTKAQYNASDFEKLSWNTSKILNEVIGLIAKDSALVRLNTLFDLDDYRDIQLLTNRFRNFSKRIFRLCLSILTFKRVIASFDDILLRNYLSRTYFNKGSPMLLYS